MDDIYEGSYDGVDWTLEDDWEYEGRDEASFEQSGDRDGTSSNQSDGEAEELEENEDNEGYDPTESWSVAPTMSHQPDDDSVELFTGEQELLEVDLRRRRGKDFPQTPTKERLWSLIKSAVRELLLGDGGKLTL